MKIDTQQVGAVRRRWIHRLHVRLAPMAALLMRPAVQRRLRELPSLPPRFRRHVDPPTGPWRPFDEEIPQELLTQPGIVRDLEAEQRAFEELPLQSFQQVHAEAVKWAHPRMWRSMLPTLPRLLRSRRRAFATGKVKASGRPRLDPEELTRRLKEEGTRIGLHAVGVAELDPRYTFAQYAGRQVGDRVIVTIVEQNHEATQTIPSHTAEQAALSTYPPLVDMSCELAAWLHAQGYRAKVDSYHGEQLVIHYAVAAGLGQLGLNGQLLTPQAGSRCRITVITTDAPLLLDQPVDYGLEGICDRCQVCVARCPVGAIPSRRSYHRGVLKAKLNTKRCYPVVAQIDGCAICMKVCPIQRYGLSAVLEEYRRSGRILGKGTDELEGYHWPLDGRYYPPGSTPRAGQDLMEPPGFPFDPNRRLPLVSANGTGGRAVGTDQAPLM